MRPQPPRCISVPHPNSKPFPTLLCSGPSCQDLGPEPPGPLLLFTCSRRPFPASALRGCSRCAPSPQCSSPAGPIVHLPNTPRSPRARRLLRYASSNLSTSGVWGRVVLWASQGLQQHPRPPPVVSPYTAQCLPGAASPPAENHCSRQDGRARPASSVQRSLGATPVAVAHGPCRSSPAPRPARAPALPSAARCPRPGPSHHPWGPTAGCLRPRPRSAPHPATPLLPSP